MDVAFTILAIVASVLSTGGIVAQIIAWRRKRDEDAAENERKRISLDAKKVDASAKKTEATTEIEKVEVTAKVELKKAELEDERHEREETGRFQTRLIERIQVLETARDSTATRMGNLEAQNAKCERDNADLRAKYGRLDGAHRKLQSEHETLKRDHEQLQKHVGRLEDANRSLRARLAKLDRGSGSEHSVAPEKLPSGAGAAKAAVAKQGGRG